MSPIVLRVVNRPRELDLAVKFFDINVEQSRCPTVALKQATNTAFDNTNVFDTSGFTRLADTLETFFQVLDETLVHRLFLFASGSTPTKNEYLFSTLG